MEHYPTIDEYVAMQMGDKITIKANSLLPSLMVFAVGIGSLILIRTEGLPDVLMATLLTVGLIGTAVGMILTAMCLTKALYHYVYQPTDCRMRRCKCYLSNDDYRRCVEAFGVGDTNFLTTLQFVASSNNVLDILYSRDQTIALLQVGRYDYGPFRPETPVILLTGKEVSMLHTLCK